MEIIALPFIYFFFFGGGAFIVAVIIIKSLFAKNSSSRPYLKWFIVIFLSLIQVSCWGMMDNFNSSFGSGGRYLIYNWLVISITVFWLIYQVIVYFIQKRNNADSDA
jgi:bacteriorhodopsin